MRILTAFLLIALIITPSCRAKETKEANHTDGILSIQEVTSKSGITAWLVEDHTLPIISLKFSFKGAGSINDSLDKQGLVLLLSNTMDEGAGNLRSQEFQKMLSDHSITLRFNSNRDNFGGQLKTLSRNQDKAFELLKSALNAPRFDAEPIERMRAANIARIKSSLSDPEWIAARILNDKAFDNHPYAQNSGGTLTSLPNITADDLKTHKQNHLTKDRLIIGVTGGITAQELKKTLDAIFGDLPSSNKEKPTKNEQALIKNGGKNFLFEQDIPQTIIRVSMPSLDNQHADYPALQVLNYIFGGGGFGSRLMEEAREKRGLTYGIYSHLYALDQMNSFNISTSTKNESTSEMMRIIRDELTRLRETPVSTQELQSAKDYIIGSMPLSLTSTDKISSILLSMQLNERPITYLDTLANKINRVTIEDIQRVATDLLQSDNLTTIMVGQPENITDTVKIEKLPNVY